MSRFEEEDPVMQYEPRGGASPSPVPPALAAKRRYEDRLLAVDGVQGVGVTEGPRGREVILVYVRDEGVAKRLPAAFDGVLVQFEVVGEIEARAEPPGGEGC